MILDRRGFLRFGLGGAATMALSAAAPLLQSTEAYAIAGVDDAVLGGLVLVMLTLGGYAVAESMSNNALLALGYDFSQYAQSASNQTAAVTRAIADANNLGVEVNRQNAEDAAAAIAAGTGAAAEWFAGIAESGRIALDGWLSGIGANQAALWGLVGEYAASRLAAYPVAASGATIGGNDFSVTNLPVSVRVATIADIMSMYVTSNQVSETPTWAIMGTWMRQGGSQFYPTFTVVIGTGPAPTLSMLSGQLKVGYSSKVYFISERNLEGSQSYSTSNSGSKTVNLTGQLYVSGDIVVGTTLPGVDRAADAPETYGAGYDKTIVGRDLVIDPTTGDVTSAGSIALPVDYPYVQLPYVDGLYGQGAGVVSGLYDLPLSGETSVVVGTTEGVVSMPVSQAIAESTSIGATVEPSLPVVPPDTPDVGPWQPAYDLPFYNVWPFNLVYTFVQQISALGGVS